MRPLLFPDDQQFWYEKLRALGHTAYGRADIGEVVTTAARIRAGDYDSWYEQWAATAQPTEAEARAQLAAGHQVWTTRGPVNNDDPSDTALRKVGTADSDGMAGSAA
jgi:hypothetical protein